MLWLPFAFMPQDPSPNQSQDPQQVATTTTRRSDVRIGRGRSPIPFQFQRPRFTPDPQALTLVFLTGPYQGQKLEVGKWLGAMVNDIGQNANAVWNERESDHLVPGSSFKRLSARSFTINVEFYDERQGVEPLVENLSLLMSLGEGASSPPLMQYIQGDLEASPVYCENIAYRYSEPLPANKGHRRCELRIAFKLQGGKNSPNAQGGALASTPLEDWRRSVSAVERRRQGVQQVIENLMAPCLGEQGSNELERIVDDNRLADIDRVLALDHNTIFQAAVAGMFPSSVLQDPRFESVFREAASLVIAQNEDGIGAVGGESPTTFARAIREDDFAGLSPELTLQAEQAAVDYQIIVQSVLSGQLDESSGIENRFEQVKEQVGNITRPSDEQASSDIFNRELNPTAGDRLRRIGSCGLSLRQLGAGAISNGLSSSDSEIEAETLRSLNTFISSNKSDLRLIRERFGLQTEAQARALVNRAPYGSKNEFFLSASPSGASINGRTIWSQFILNTEEDEEGSTPGAVEDVQ